MPRIALLQMTASDDPGQNLAKAITLIKQAAKNGGQIICLPELFLSRYFCQTEDPKFFELAETIPGPTTEELSPLARQLGVIIVVSIFEGARVAPPPGKAGSGPPLNGPSALAGQERYNTALVIDADGKILGKYRKRHVPDDLKNYYGEAFYFKKGDSGYPVFKTKYATIGMQVCYDQWFPEGARALAQAGAEIIFYPTAIGQTCQTGRTGPTDEGERDAWVTVQRAHAISNGVFVAACNRVGVEDHLNFWGTSFVADPMGKVLGKASSDKEETLIVECDLSRIEEARRNWPFLREC